MAANQIRKFQSERARAEYDSLLDGREFSVLKPKGFVNFSRGFDDLLLKNSKTMQKIKLIRQAGPENEWKRRIGLSPLGMIKWDREDFEFFVRYQERLLDMSFDRYITDHLSFKPGGTADQKTLIGGPADLDRMRKIMPKYWEAREKLLEDNMDYSLRYQRLLISPPKDFKDWTLLYTVSTGLVAAPDSQWYLPDQAPRTMDLLGRRGILPEKWAAEPQSKYTLSSKVRPSAYLNYLYSILNYNDNREAVSREGVVPKNVAGLTKKIKNSAGPDLIRF